MTRYLLAALLLSPPMPGPPAAFYTTYTYTAYTVYDYTTGEAPATRVSGVGGTLALRADGTYAKRLSLLLGDSGPRFFSQQGKFTTKGDSIVFRFTDLKGSDVQRGTYHYNAKTRRLSLTILGYPTGNKGVYDLVATAPPAR